ncbi:hypothetical protein [Bacteroides thetaiotaomicron]|uniref:hypothetical protein n=1 Tax=Bacteroides thetaiotaomicron TaxID=818 RepID=UPI0040632719
MSSDYNDFNHSQSPYESGLEGEFGSEDPPEGYESWAEWYYYNGESEDETPECLDEPEACYNQLSDEEIDRKQEAERRRIIRKAKKEGVHPDIYSRTDGQCPKWVQKCDTWFYKHPAFYTCYKVILFFWFTVLFILIVRECS